VTGADVAVVVLVEQVGVGDDRGTLRLAEFRRWRRVRDHNVGRDLVGAVSVRLRICSACDWDIHLVGITASFTRIKDRVAAQVNGITQRDSYLVLV